MIIPIYWKQKTRIRNLKQLLDSYHKHGGAIVQYDRVIAIILFTQRTPRFEWVGPDTTRRSVGLKHALWCFFLGWWSIAGFFWTAGAIINNLMGGIDVTRILTSPPPLPGQPFDDSAIRELRSAQKRQQIAYLIFLLVLLVLIVAIFVISYI